MLYDLGTEGQTRSVYFVASMGLLTGDSILLHVWLNDPHVVREYGAGGRFIFPSVKSMTMMSSAYQVNTRYSVFWMERSLLGRKHLGII